MSAAMAYDHQSRKLRGRDTKHVNFPVAETLAMLAEDSSVLSDPSGRDLIDERIVGPAAALRSRGVLDRLWRAPAACGVTLTAVQVKNPWALLPPSGADAWGLPAPAEAEKPERTRERPERERGSGSSLAAETWGEATVPTPEAIAYVMTALARLNPRLARAACAHGAALGLAGLDGPTTVAEGDWGEGAVRRV
jgi:hypothetical protein